MADQELLALIQQQRRKRASDARIQKAALSKGWNEADVKGAYAYLAFNQNVVPESPGGRHPSSTLSDWASLLVTSVLLVAGAVAWYEVYMKFVLPMISSAQVATVSSVAASSTAPVDGIQARPATPEEAQHIFYKAKTP